MAARFQQRLALIRRFCVVSGAPLIDPLEHCYSFRREVSLEASNLARSSPISAKVFVGNLNYRTTKEELVAFLSPAGEIVDAFLPTDRETGRPRGFGFITFATEAQAQACIEQFDGVELSGRRLNINKADDRGRKPRRSAPATEFKRGSRGGGGGGGGDRPRGDRPPRGGPRRGGGPPGAGRPGRSFGAPPPPPPTEPEYTTEDRRFQEDDDEDVPQDEWGDSQGWKKKKKKKAKGSRRGLRAKKRSL